MNSPYQIPCRHSMQSGDFFVPSFFHPRYINQKTLFNSKKSTISIKENESKRKDLSYQSIMMRLQPYAEMASKHDEVGKIFSQTFNDLDNLKIEKNQNMPLTLTTKGKLNEHPSHNVIGGRSRSKAHYKCSNCHQFGHNIKRCPKLNFKNINE